MTCCAVALRSYFQNDMFGARQGRGMGMEWHGKCESNTAALCKSNVKDTIQTISDKAWQEKCRCAAWARHAMCELALTLSHIAAADDGSMASETTTKIISVVFQFLTSSSLFLCPSAFIPALLLYRIFLIHPCNTLNKSFPPLRVRPVSRMVGIWLCGDVVSYTRERNSQLHGCETLKHANFRLLSDDFSLKWLRG